MIVPMTDDEDAYAILGVPRDADDATITAAHRALARHHHPDVAGEGATGRMMRINAAFDAIRTADRRAEYDGHAVAPDEPAGSRASTAATAPGAGRDAAEDRRERLRWRQPNDGTGKAGPPPGRPSGSVLDFGRHKGWSLGEIARVDPGYLVWLEERREGRPYLEEIDALLRRTGNRPADGARERSDGPSRPRRGVFGRR